MLDFIKRTKEEVEVDKNEIEIPEEEDLYNEKDVLDISALIMQLEYTNTYLAQLVMTQRELLKQQTVANALTILNHQYEHPDSFMNIDEIQKKYLALAREIFVDYQDDNLSNLEEKN